VATLDPARPVDESDGAWLAALRAGDDDAFERLVRANIGCLLAVARRLLRDPRDAEEVVQEAFISALRALPRFRAECRVSTWLHRIVVNHALMRLRARRRRPELPIDTLLPIFTADGRRVEPADVPDPERALAAAETRQAVRAAIDRLPDAYRTVLILRDIEELDTPTVAAQLGITANAVKIRLHRARQALMTLMSPVGLRSATFVVEPPRAAGAAAC
jgi:RNA polymerase sigma-70 factor (ECF subfamily)